MSYKKISQNKENSKAFVKTLLKRNVGCYDTLCDGKNEQRENIWAEEKVDILVNCFIFISFFYGIVHSLTKEIFVG